MVRDGYYYGFGLLVVAVLVHVLTGGWAMGCDPGAAGIIFPLVFSRSAARDSRWPRADCFSRRWEGYGDRPD